MNDNTRIPQYELLINGKWVPPESGQYSTILNPATEEVIAHVAAGSEKDVDAAAKAAKAALKVWNGISAAERGRILNRLADLLEKKPGRTHCIGKRKRWQTDSQRPTARHACGD